MVTGPIGFVAVIAGWVVTEVGRQPWVVQGLLRTDQASSLISGEQVAFTLALFVITYSVLFVAFGIFFRHLVRQGQVAVVEGTLPKQVAARPAFMAVGEEK